LAESLGGAESLVKNPWLMSTSPLSDDERRQSGLTPSLIRMSVGLEDVEDLIADIEQALEKACA
jgi:cystathionine beta-lyase/cystathionine gamma-synthase